MLGGSITHWKTVPSSEISNINNLYKNGVYNITNVQDSPFVYCVMLVINYSGLECIQIAFNILGGSAKKRVYVNNSWTEWDNW